MKNETHLSISQPCHEDWNNMTPEAKGRFCASCQKTVVDFSLMTDNEVLSYLSKQSENVCGRFDTDQLQRPLIETQLQPHKNWKYWLASVSALFLLGNKSSAQTTQQSTFQQSNVEKASEDTLKYPSIKGKVLSERLLEGVVTDTANVPMHYTSIRIKGFDIYTSTDSYGRFSLKTNNLPDTFTLIVAYIGYKTQVITIEKAKSKKLRIQLKLDSDALLGDVVIVKRVKKRNTLSTSLSNLFKKEAFTIYPNPVNRIGNVNLKINDVANYEIQLLDANSKVCLSQKHTTISSKESYTLTLPANITSGMYYIRLINTVTKKQWVDKLIVQ